MRSGERIGRYEILGELGRGAMGAVYRARDTKLGREVAIKTIVASEELGVGRDELVHRLESEAKVAARLAHPGIVAIHDVAQEGQVSYLVLELVEGESLAQYLARGARPSPGEALEIAAQVADALAVAHGAGIVHRDIKPANLLLTRDGRIKVSDFGIAKAIGEHIGLTRSGTLIGSPAYMAPEQIKCEPLDGRSDLFSLGAVLFELLFGRKPFPADTITGLVYEIVHVDPFAGARANPPLDEGVLSLLRWTLAKARDERIPDARTFSERSRALARQLARSTGAAEHARTSHLPLPEPTFLTGAVPQASGRAQTPTRKRWPRSFWPAPAAAIALSLVAYGYVRSQGPSVADAERVAPTVAETPQPAPQTGVPELPPEVPPSSDAEAPLSAAASKTERPLREAAPESRAAAGTADLPTRVGRIGDRAAEGSEVRPVSAAIDSLGYRTGVPQTLEVPERTLAPSPQQRLLDEFGRRYRAAGRPRAVLFWNREVDDEVGVELETTSHTRRGRHSSKQTSIEETSGPAGSGQLTEAESVERRERDERVSTRRIDVGAREHGLGERNDWVLESSFTGALQNAGLRLVDRNVAMRGAQVRSGAASTGEQQLVEARALVDAAEWVIEVTLTPDDRAALGWAFRVDFTDTRTGEIVVRRFSQGHLPEPAPAEQRPFVAGARGFERQRAVPVPVNGETVGRQVAVEVLAELIRRLPEPSRNPG